MADALVRAWRWREDHLKRADKLLERSMALKREALRLDGEAEELSRTGHRGFVEAVRILRGPDVQVQWLGEECNEGEDGCLLSTGERFLPSN